MLYAAWIVASILCLPIGLLIIVVTAVTGWQLLPLPLLNLSAVLMLASVPGVTYVIATRD